MGAFLKLVDAVLFLCFLVLAVAFPLIGSQTAPCKEHLPRVLVDLHDWYNRSSGDYLFVERPHFFMGLLWLQLLLVWPLCLVNLYGIGGSRPWLGTTCLICGVSVVAGMAAVFGELVGSGKATEKLLVSHGLFWAFGALATVRGLLRPDAQPPTIKSKSSTATMNGVKNPPLARKKRA